MKFAPPSPALQPPLGSRFLLRGASIADFLARSINPWHSSCHFSQGRYLKSESHSNRSLFNVQNLARHPYFSSSMQTENQTIRSGYVESANRTKVAA